MGDSFQGRPLVDGRNQFLQQTRHNRRKREEEQHRIDSAITIQQFYLGLVAKRVVRTTAIERFQILMADFNPEEDKLLTAMDVFQASGIMLRFCRCKVPVDILDKLCRYFCWSQQQVNPAYSYIACGFSKDTAKLWVRHLKDLANCCLHSAKLLKSEFVSESKQLFLVLSTMLGLLSLHKWQFLQNPQYTSLIPGVKKLTCNILEEMKANSKLYLTFREVLLASLVRPDKYFLPKTCLQAISTMLNRSVVLDTTPTSVDMKALKQYTFEILTVPGFVHHMRTVCPRESMDFPWTQDILKIIQEQHEILDNDLLRKLSLLANIIHLGEMGCNILVQCYPNYFCAISILVVACGKHTNCARKTHWHPFLGWIDTAVPPPLLNCVGIIKSQIERLWGPMYLKAVFRPLSAHLRGDKPPPNYTAEEIQRARARANARPLGLFKSSVVKVFRKAFGNGNNPEPRQYTPGPHVKYDEAITLKVSEACELYTNVISVFSVCRVEVLSGLCFKHSSKWLVNAWTFLYRICTWNLCQNVLLKSPRKVQENLVCMFADAMSHYITMLDDHEMYEEQSVFKLDDYILISKYINHLFYDLMTHENSVVLRSETKASLKTLFTVLYRRDCRRRFCPKDHWLIGNATKMNNLISDILRGYDNWKVGKYNVPEGIEKQRRILCDMPHTIREDFRVVLFRKWVANDKARNGSSTSDLDFTSASSSSSSTLITIQRGRIVEDGYAQLASVNPKAMKGTIRVRFQNELGLDEAGIDQDGVFKEFLEETISAVFNPSMNLFRTTSENLLYPSYLSYLHDNHLQLFEFVGKMLGKALYEGIVVDVHFAPFFLSQILGFQQNALFSAIDELQSLDRELYTSLTYIKHYEGNVEDLDLTFSVNQECLGDMQTIELIPGGKGIVVNNQNKISYLYQKAHFHLHAQIREQTSAFLKGFRSIITKDWIEVFSPLELQRLISGEDSNINLVDLRRNTQYYGGFHDNHRVVVWLWEILQNEFTEEERRQFLKFVTSCSKPPLLGFSNLDPPFSIRCVEVSDDEDTGDTIGSVLRGFLTIGKKDPVGRLPTSSTCFNLLKLPNYQKKATLRDKLRYAITSNVGFELS